MTEIEKMEQYINNTGLTQDQKRSYDINMRQALELLKEVSEMDALLTAFRYGQAKGYRCAMAEVRK